MTELTRRTVLLSTTALGAAGLAGCVGDSDDNAGNGGADTGDDNAGNGGADTGDDNGTENSASDGSSGNDPGDSIVTLETVDTDCAQGDHDTASIDRGEDVVTVLGTTPAPNPCQEAVLAEWTIGEESFTLVIDVADATESDACQDCVGKVEYEARIDVDDPSMISEGTVRHVEGGSHSVAVGSESDEAGGRDEGGAASVSDASIETVDASCGGGTEHERLVAVSRTAGGVTIDGVLQTSNPCHRAVLTGVAVTDGRLTVDVAAESTLGEGEVCVQCVGAVQYTVDVELSNADALTGVTVSHPDGEQFSFDADDLDSG